MPLVLVIYNLGAAPRSVRFNTALGPALPEADLSTEQLEIKKIADKWNQVRVMDREEAESSLDPEWLEAYNRYLKKFEDDMARMMEIQEKMAKQIEPPKVQKKSLKQKKRDMWAKVQAREAARAKKAAQK